MTAAEKERCSWLRHTHVNVHWEYWKNVSLKEQKIDRVLFPGSKDTGTIHLCVLLAMGESENGEEERRTCLLLLLEAEAWIENGPQEEVAAPSSSSLLFLLLSHWHIWFDTHSRFENPSKRRIFQFSTVFGILNELFTIQNVSLSSQCLNATFYVIFKHCASS